MPGIVASSAPTLVMPQTLCTQFTLSLEVLAKLNEYPDGRSTRKALQDSPRRKWTLGIRATPQKLAALKAFFDLVGCMKAFWFYDYREGQWDPYGLSEAGRYPVVFRGGWSEDVLLGRAECSLVLEEIE